MLGINFSNHDYKHSNPPIERKERKKVWIDIVTFFINDKAQVESTGSLEDLKGIATMQYAARFKITSIDVRLNWIPIAWDKDNLPVLFWAEHTNLRISLSKKEVWE